MQNLLFLIIFSLISTINLKFETENIDFFIELTATDDCYIWNNNTIALRTNITNPISIFNSSDYENIAFDIGIKEYNKDIIINMKCHLWKPKEDNCLAICDIEKEPLIKEFYHFTINSIIAYKNKKIKFISKTYSYLDSQGPNVPFIYSNQQVIDLNDEKDFYYFYYKTGAIQETNLILDSTRELYMLPVDNCDVKQRDMICKVSKKKIESFLIYNDGSYKATIVAIFIGKDYDIKKNPFTYTIEISKKEIQKTNIYVEVKRMLTPPNASTDYLAYETNVTNIDILRTKNSVFIFTGESGNYQTSCFFKKNEDDTPLLLVCVVGNNYGTYRLKKVNHLSLDLIDYKYNFTLTYQNEESFTRKEHGDYILVTYPEVLDFTSKKELNFTIDGYIYDCGKLTLSPKSGNLKCEFGRYHSFVQCIVPKSHFKGEKSGYYYLHYPDSLGDISLYYEANPFKVILSGSFNYYNINKIICILSLLLFL